MDNYIWFLCNIMQTECAWLNVKMYLVYCPEIIQIHPSIQFQYKTSTTTIPQNYCGSARLITFHPFKLELLSFSFLLHPLKCENKGG